MKWTSRILSLVLVHAMILGLLPLRARAVSDMGKLNYTNTISLGQAHAIAIGADGRVFSWGNNTDGQLGLGDSNLNNSRTIPTKVSGLSKVVAVSTGWEISAAITETGDLYTWGRGRSALGHGDSASLSRPTKVQGLSGVAAVSLGWNHSIAVTKNGDLYTWGNNDWGQLGLGNSGIATDRYVPTKVQTLSNVVAIGAGGSYSLAITANGDLYSWGLNSDGTLGLGIDGSNTSKAVPTKVAGLSNVVAISAGNSSAAAITTNGDLYSWGRNNMGQLGLGDTVDRNLPQKVPGLSNVTAVSFGPSLHSAAITASGDVYTWGDNNQGQLGLGYVSEWDDINRAHTTPTKVPGLSNAVAVSVGQSFSAALIANGVLYAWGSPQSGQLGLGFSSGNVADIKSTPQYVMAEINVPVNGRQPALSEADLFRYFPNLIRVPGLGNTAHDWLFRDLYEKASEIVDGGGSSGFSVFMGQLKPSRALSTIARAISSLITGEDLIANDWYDQAAEALYLEITQHILLDSMDALGEFRDAFDSADEIADVFDALNKISKLETKYLDGGILGKAFGEFSEKLESLGRVQDVAKYTLLTAALYSVEMDTLQVLKSRLRRSDSYEGELYKALLRLERQMTLDPVAFMLARYANDKFVGEALGLILSGNPLVKTVGACLGVVSDIYSSFFPTGKEDVEALFFRMATAELSSALANITLELRFDSQSDSQFDEQKMQDYRTVYNAYIVALREYANSAKKLTKNKNKILEIDERLGLLLQYGSYDIFISHRLKEAANSLEAQWDYTVTDDGIVIHGLKQQAAPQAKLQGLSLDDSSEYEDAILVIPSQIEGTPVIGIGENAFRGEDRLKCVFIEDGIQYIERGAFSECPSLVVAKVSGSISEIDEDAFSGCDNFVDVTILGNDVRIAPTALSGGSPNLSIYGITGLGIESIAEQNGCVFTPIDDKVLTLEFESFPPENQTATHGFDDSGMVLIASYANGAVERLTSGWSIIWENERAGIQTILVTYKDGFAELTVNVLDIVLPPLPGLAGTVTVIGIPQYNDTLSVDTSSLVTDPLGEDMGELSYLWLRDDTTEIGTGDTYTITETDIGATITVTVTAANCLGGVVSDPTATIGKADGPAAPSVAGAYSGDGTEFTYTVTPVENAQYRIDSDAWQDSNVFTGIAPLSNHTFSARVKETATHEAGAIGSTEMVTFSLLNDRPAPTLDYDVTGDTSKTITITPVDGAEYKFGEDGWGSANEQAFPAGETVTIQIRLAATATHVASPAATTSVNLAKGNQTAPVSIHLDYAYNGLIPNTFTATITEADGCEYSFDGSTFTGTNTTTAQPGDTVTGYIRKAETPALNASPAIHDSVTLPVPVTSIAVSGAGSASTITTGGGTLQLLADVAPATATDKAVTWSITSGGEYAALDASGLLTAAGDGAVTVRATADDGYGAHGEVTIVISGQSVSVPVITITDHPANKTVTAGSISGSLSVTANVAPSVALSYQWYSNTTASTVGGTAVAGAESDHFTIPTALTAGTYYYFCEVSAEGAASVRSNVATVTVQSNGGGSFGPSGGVPASPVNKVELTINGQTMTMTGDNNGTLNLNCTADDIKRYADGTTTYKIEVPNGYEHISLSLPIHALGDNDLRITTAFGAVEIPNAALQAFGEEHGDTLRLSLVKGSFKIALFGGDGKEISYSDPIHPFALRLPYARHDKEKSEAVVAIAKSGRAIPFSGYQDGFVSFAITETGTYDVAYRKKDFHDVVDHWAESNIDFVTARELFLGTSDTDFSPGTSMTRAMFVTVLARLDGVDLAAYTARSFSDIPEDAYYAAAAEWAIACGITSGVGGGRFAPDKSITREEMAVLIANYLDYKAKTLPQGETEPFADAAQVATWAADAVATVQNAGILMGKPGGLFDPQGTATRAEVAAIFTRLIQAAAK